MSQELAPATAQISTATRPHYGLDRDQVELIKRTIAKGATDDELQLFKAQCDRTGLDPFARQIYAVKRWSAADQREIMQTQVSIDGFRLIADRTGKYAGQTEPQWCGSDGQWKDVWLDSAPPAAAKVGVLRVNFQQPVYAVARYDAYVQTVSANKGGGPNLMWKKMPDVMLSKCAEALALRKAFPQELSGLYTPDEMGQAENQTPTPIAAPVVQTQNVPEEVQRMWDHMKSIATVCEVFKEIKTRMIEVMGPGGETEYYRLMKRHGACTHANELKQKAARVTSQKMWESIKLAESLAISEDDMPQPEPEVMV